MVKSVLLCLHRQFKFKVSNIARCALKLRDIQFNIRDTQFEL